jgi:hypothetical protein
MAKWKIGAMVMDDGLGETYEEDAELAKSLGLAPGKQEKAPKAPAAGLAARAELVKRAKELGLKGSGTVAELTEKISARELELA